MKLTSRSETAPFFYERKITAGIVDGVLSLVFLTSLLSHDPVVKTGGVLLSAMLLFICTASFRGVSVENNYICGYSVGPLFGLRIPVGGFRMKISELTLLNSLDYDLLELHAHGSKKTISFRSRELKLHFINVISIIKPDIQISKRLDLRR